MKPDLLAFTLPGFGHVVLSPFFTTIFIGTFLAAIIHVRRARALGLNPVIAFDMVIIAIVAAIIGSRLFHIVFEFPRYPNAQFYALKYPLNFIYHLIDASKLPDGSYYYLKHPWRVFDFARGGFVSLGAYVCSAFGWWYYFRRKHISIRPYLDCVVFAVPMIEFWVRVGCFLIGCCYGKVTNFPIHLRFPPGSTAFYFMHDAPLHATQLYFMAEAILLYIAIRVYATRQRFAGELLAVFLIADGALRFVIEYLRGDRDRGIYLEQMLPGGISTGQIFMLIAIVSGIACYVRWRPTSILPSARSS